MRHVRDGQRRWALGGCAGAGLWLALAALMAAPAAAAQSPWASPFQLPGTIEAEQFDRGGEGVAYHDLEAANRGGAYRASEGVDIESTADSGGGYNLGYVRPSEWLEYTVDVPAGTYDLGLRVASGSAGGRMHLEYRGVDVTGPISIPSTGGWQSWTTVWVTGVPMAAGNDAVLRLSLDAANSAGSSIANVNSILVRAADGADYPSTTPTPTPTPPPTPSPTPAAAAQSPWASPFQLPGTIEAEQFDRGGEGVAYHDLEAANRGGAYRASEGVDIESTADSGGGYNLGYVRPSEWLEYTVDVPAGTYDLGLRVASGSAGGRMHLEYRGVDVTGPISIPSTGGWQSWTTVWVTGVPMAAGNDAVLRLSLDAANSAGSSIANVNSILVRAADGPTPTPTPTPTPAPTPFPTSGLLWPSTWSSGASAPAPRFESTAVLVGGKVYSFGGFYDYDQLVRRDYVAYDVARNSWTKLGNLPSGMAETHLGAATDGRYIYLAGGLGGNVQHGENPPQWISSRVYRYDTTTNAWTQITSLPAARGAGGLALIGRTLHYFGGVIADINTDRTDHWAYDLDTKTWTTKAPMPEAKDHFSTMVVGGQIYALLGEFGHHVEQRQLTTAHRYDPATNTWIKLANGPQGKSHAESSTFVSNGRIVIAGGQIENSASTDRVAAYDPATNSWQNLAVLPAKRQGTIVQKSGSTFVITTGGVGTRSPLANTWRGG